MTRRELIQALASQTHGIYKDTENTLNALVEIIESRVEQGEKVLITGFGVFDRRTRAARHGVDPRSGVDIRVPEMHVPGFHGSVSFKKRVRQH